MNLTPKDLETLKERGIGSENIAEELEMLRIGFPYLKIQGPATPLNGIKTLNSEMQHEAAAVWEKYLSEGDGKVMKMVPASGAASRMFKDLFTFLNSDRTKPKTSEVKAFFEGIEKFPFFRRLNLRCLQRYGKSINSLIAEGKYKEIVELLLKSSGLGYGDLPKALLSFHPTMGSNRTPMEEHLSEAAAYATGKDGVARIHFTVSPEHIPYFKSKLEEVKAIMEHKYGKELEVTFSVQKPSTDTVATLADGRIYREDGEIFFRPGGHGALIENLNDLDADVVFIKNIDNVLPESGRATTIEWKKLLGGVLVSTKAKIDHYCKLLASGTPVSDELIAEMFVFLHTVLCVTNENEGCMTKAEKQAYLKRKFNRPLRVCGMVKNEGEPGGGPFLCYSSDGSVQPQILESTQVNPKDHQAQKAMKEATHFNPVDLVVALKDADGKKFNLLNYVDKSTGFISQKSRKGVEINALELPGLWNGAMSDWNTIFVDVPGDTFSPVKTVNDLLRPAHQDY